MVFSFCSILSTVIVYHIQSNSDHDVLRICYTTNTGHSYSHDQPSTIQEDSHPLSLNRSNILHSPLSILHCYNWKESGQWAQLLLFPRNSIFASRLVCCSIRLLYFLGRFLVDVKKEEEWFHDLILTQRQLCKGKNYYENHRVITNYFFPNYFIFVKTLTLVVWK